MTGHFSLAQRSVNAASIWHGDRFVGRFKNLSLRRGSLLLAQCLAQPGSATGITHLGLGSGIGNGTLMLPQKPDPNATQLRTEVSRVPITSVSYADITNDEGDTITDGVISNKLDYYIEVSPIDSEFLVTEIGLFGGEGADEPNGGVMYGWITFPVIDNREGGQVANAPLQLRFTWRVNIPILTPDDLEAIATQ